MNMYIFKQFNRLKSVYQLIGRQTLTLNIYESIEFWIEFINRTEYVGIYCIW